MTSDLADPTIAAEQIVIGAAMLTDDGSAVPALSAIVSDSDFARPAHQIVWQAITTAHTESEPTGPVAIATRLAATGELTKVGGGPYLHDLLASVPTGATAGHYAKLVADAAARRRASVAATRIAQAATEPGTDLAAVVQAAQADLVADSGQVWPDPIPLTTGHELPGFPSMVLPDWLGEMVEATATATQTPADLAGSVVLACLSAATMGRIIVEPVSGWLEQTSLFTCTALGPGNRKSTVFKLLSQPLWDAETDLAEQIRPQAIEAAIEKQIAEKSAEAAMANAGKTTGDPDAVNNAKRAAIDADAIEIPTVPVLVADDITPEATKTLLAQQDGRLAVMSAEGGVFQTIAGRYSGVPDPDVYLKGHAGDSLRVTRKSAPAEHIDRPALTVGLAVQPSVLRDAARMPGFEDRGLLARFLWSLPVSTVGKRDPSPPPVPAGVRETYHRRLRDLAMTMWHATDTTLTLTPEARDHVIALEAEREPRLASGGEWEPILSWANKWTGAVVRIAGLLHVAEHFVDGWRRPIDADTIDAAAIIGHYYAQHALAVWDFMATGPTGPATTVLNWLTKQRQPTWKKRDLWRSLHRRIRSTDNLDTALRVLETHGYIRIYQPERTGRGRRPSPRIHVHPNLTGDDT